MPAPHDPGTGAAAVDALGQRLPCPPYADPAAWRRFANHTVDVPLGCLLWLASPRDDGYGQFWAPHDSLRFDPAEVEAEQHVEETGLVQLSLFDDEPGPPEAPPPEPGKKSLHWRAHRWSWLAHHGPIPERRELMHVCDEPLCVRPSHLELGTTADNAMDRDRKGRLVHRGRHGVMFYGTRSRKDQREHSAALHTALAAAVKSGVRPDQLPRIVARVTAEAMADDQPLFAEQPSRKAEP